MCDYVYQICFIFDTSSDSRVFDSRDVYNESAVFLFFLLLINCCVTLKNFEFSTTMLSIQIARETVITLF